ncbi:MAG TPA: TonB-dependent receptor [Thermoanaerobaculia bacterium]
MRSALAIFAICAAGSSVVHADETAGTKNSSLDDLLNQKVSAAAKYEQTTRDAAASVTIVTAEEIESFGFDTLAEVLANVRSFYVSYDRNYDYVGTRGFSRPSDYNDRILLLVDGHTINENIYGMAPVGTDFGIPLAAVERIEIVRGPGSSLYGTYAMLAVVDVIMKTGGGVGGVHASAEVGSFGRKGASLTWGKVFPNGLDVMATGRYLDVTGQDLTFPEFADAGGVARGLDGDRAISALVSVQKDGLSIRGSATWRRKDVPTAAFGTIFGDSRMRTTDEHEWLDLSKEVVLSFDKVLTVRAYADRYQYDGVYPYDTFLEKDRSTGVWAGGEARFRWDLTSGHRFTLGTEYRYNFRSTYSYEFDGVPAFDADIHSSVFSVYAQDEIQLHRELSLTLGVRHDVFSTSPDATSPRVGVVWSYAPRGTLKLLYGEAFRTPNTYEALYPQDEASTPALQPERIRTLEANLQQGLAPWLLGTASVYRYQMRDLIDPVAEPDGNIGYLNRSRVAANGFELQLDARLPNGLQVSASYALQAARDDQGAALTNSPRNVFKASIRRTLFGAVAAGGLLRCESARLTVYGTETDAACVTDIHLSARPLGGLSLSVTIRNLFDTRYATPGGLEHIQPAIEQNGRSVVGRAAWSF